MDDPFMNCFSYSISIPSKQARINKPMKPWKRVNWVANCVFETGVNPNLGGLFRRLFLVGEG